MNALPSWQPKDELSVEYPRHGTPFVLVGSSGGVPFCCRYSQLGWEWFALTLTGTEIPLRREDVDVVSMARIEALAQSEFERFVEQEDARHDEGWTL